EGRGGLRCSPPPVGAGGAESEWEHADRLPPLPGPAAPFPGKAGSLREPLAGAVHSRGWDASSSFPQPGLQQLAAAPRGGVRAHAQPGGAPPPQQPAGGPSQGGGRSYPTPAAGRLFEPPKGAPRGSGSKRTRQCQEV
ncbi:unnamed protein product, partial [Discosporangium mesarthrocarpum]